MDKLSIIREIASFAWKQASACLFGLALLLLIAGSAKYYPADAPITRYDWLFLTAIAIQIGLIASRLETWNEATVIAIFHVVGTLMELFKTQMGSWVYPESAFFRIGGVPLFTGFMYSAVGSYLARSLKLFAAQFSHYPAFGWTILLSILIYANFFTHHFWLDIRIGLFAMAFVLFWRTRIWLTIDKVARPFPLLLFFLGVASTIWLAENIGSFTRTWIYPSQRDGFTLVPVEKLGSWYLLMVISFVLVALVRKPALLKG